MVDSLGTGTTYDTFPSGNDGITHDPSVSFVSMSKHCPTVTHISPSTHFFPKRSLVLGVTMPSEIDTLASSYYGILKAPFAEAKMSTQSVPGLFIDCSS